MKNGKIKLIWSLSITAALLVILLQGYWLYNQYLYTLEKSADEMDSKVLSVWNDYKTLQKNKLKSQKENVKSYNTNMDQHSTIYVSDTKENVTDWSISIQTLKGNALQKTDKSKEKLQEASKKSTTALSLELIKGIQSKLNKVDTLKSMTDTLKKPLRKEQITESSLRQDSSLINTFSFKTQKGQNLVYDAVDLYLSDLNLPFRKNVLDSLIREKTGNRNILVDTLSLKTDSVLWEPRTVKKLSFFHSSLTIHIPYNPLKKKVFEITVPLTSEKIIGSMALQIIFCLILIITLIVCLLLQIKTISRQMRVNELRQNFVNTTIHELKRPVQTLKMIVSHLQNSPKTENTDILNDARIETDNLTSYVQKLREVNEAENLAESLHLSYFDFTALAQENLEKIKKSSGKTVSIESRFPDTPLMITADKMALSNVIDNLLENAVKYSGEKSEIIFTIKRMNDNLTFSIADNGIGISSSEQNRIFEPFYRSKSSYVASLPGMGLGLSYVKMIVEAHRGSIHLTSKVNSGTTVSVEIPLQ